MTDDGRRGDFPYNYVEIINQNEADRIRTGSQFIGKAPAAGPADKVQKVKVTPIQNSVKFTIEAFCERKKVIGTKEVSDFRSLDENLRFLFPNFDRPLPPFWADKVYESEPASKKRGQVLEGYLNKLVGSNVEITEYALISWLSPRESFNCPTEIKQQVRDAQQSAAKNNGGRNSYNEAIANATPLARAEFPWDATDAVELPLQRGTIVAVRNQNTLSPGWWEGETSDGQRGLFPSNYVKMVAPEVARNLIRGESQPTSKAPTPGWNSTYDATNNTFTSPVQSKPTPQNIPASNKPSNRQRKTENNFAMPSLDAFDELLLEGFTMLSNNKLLIAKEDASTPREGDKVNLSYVAYVWDCQKQRIIEFASSDLPDNNNFVGPLEFTVGQGETIKGLERAIQNLEVGQKSRVVIRPDMGYGEVGNPPNVPPNCHLIYDITLEAIGSSSPAPVSSPQKTSYDTGRNLAEAYGQAAKNGGGNSGIVQDRQRRPNHTRANQMAAMAYQQEQEVGGAKKMYDLKKMREIVEAKAYKQYEVVPLYLEEHLNDQAFTEAFNCTRTEFMLMPKWKRNKLKQDANLY